MRTFKLVEYPNLALLNFITHPDIYPEHRERLLNYIQIAKDKKCVEVTYTKEQYGRYFVNGNFMSSINMWNKIRSTLFGETEYDIDIVNCHPEILLGLFKKYEYETEYLAKYCESRDKIIEANYISEQVITDYNSFNKDNKNKKDLIKSLFTIIIYGGNVNTWASEYNLKDTDYKLNTFVKRFTAELHENIHTFVKLPEFKGIYNFSRNKQLVSAKTKYAKKFKEDLFIINHFKVLSVILQEYESNVLECAMKYIGNRGYTVTSYNYDGFQIKMNDNFVISDLNKFIKNEFPGIRIEFIIKPFKPGLNASEFIVLDSERYSREIMIKSPIYTVQKDYFEKFHFKILNPFCFIREDSEEITFIKPHQLDGMYNDISTEPPYKCTSRNFTYYWTRDETMRYYHSINYYPRASDCPDHIYNLWKPFPILRTLSSVADTSFIHNFIRTVIGDDAVVEYLLNWFAHVVQFPSRKTEVCLIFFGNQGCGKSSIAEHLLELIIGDEKMIITSKVDKVFGRFVNTQGKLLSVLNETSGKETFNLSEILKDAITCQKTEQEKKGIDAISIIDYTNYIFTTNNINSVKIPKDDRRYMPIEFNNSYLNNTEFFEKLYAQFANKSVMRSFYDELMARDISRFSLSNNRVETELMREMKFMNADPIEQFLDYWNEHLTTHMTRKMKSSDLYQKFRHFWEVEEGKTSDMPTHTKFSIRIKRFTDRVTFAKNGCIYFTLII
jgi:predicted transposase YbfD/YdcC